MCLGYYSEGFLAIQRAVDLSIMSELGGMSSAQDIEDIGVELKSFPYPPYHNDNFIIIIETQLPFIIMLSFIVTAPIICKDVVLEKEKKLKVSSIQCLFQLLGVSNGSKRTAKMGHWLLLFKNIQPSSSQDSAATASMYVKIL